MNTPRPHPIVILTLGCLVFWAGVILLALKVL